MSRPLLPGWARTVRFRLAVTYSALVFGIAAAVLAGVYVALSRTVEAAPLTSEKFYVTDSGAVKFIDSSGSESGEYVSAADLDLVQAAVNQGTLDTLRTYSFAALVGLFLLSVGVGWWVSGRALRPVDAITRTAREINATDLSRRIGATGPHDELRTLADTIDDMLARLDAEFAAQRALVDDISHELRNPVAVIQANADAVFADVDATPENRRRAAEVVSRAAASMTLLIEDLLAIARRRSGAFAEREVRLGEITRHAVEEYRLMAAERAVQVTVRSDLPGPAVYADEFALTRVLRNLLANAVRFSPAGGEIAVVVGSRRGWAWVAVRDEGPGIQPPDQSRIFDRFYSRDHAHHGGSNGPRNGSGGSGIGLAIARQIVEAHDGRLSVFSEPGTGSTFVIWLPDRTIAGPGHRDPAMLDADPLGRR